MRNLPKLLIALCALLCPALASAQTGVRWDGLTLSPSGKPVSANVAVCNSPGLLTTAAQVIGNTAILTFGTSPITAGFAPNMQIAVSGFSGGDTYFNVGTLQPFASTVTISAVSATTITFPLTHANASASTNGSVFQMGNGAQACAPLASIFSDVNVSVPITQPGFASSNIGNVGFYVNPGAYAIQYYGTGITTYLQPLTLTMVFLNGNNNFIGDNTFCESNEVLYVGGAITCWTGADIAAQINTAYATACPSRGCRIHVLSQASCYVVTTAISFSTAAKPALLEGDPGGASCISWATASTSINAITLDWGVSEKESAGVRDLQIIGPGQGTTSNGILLGSTLGAEASLLSGIRCGTTAGLTDGFGTCIAMGVTNNDFIIKVANSFLMNSGVGLGITQGSEGFYISDSLIARNTTGISNTTGTDLSVSNSSIDDNGTGISASGGGTVECYDCHYENLGVPAASASYVVLTNSSSYIAYGGIMQDDQAVGTTTQFIQGNSGVCYVGIFGTQFTTLGRTLTEIANLTNSCRAHLMPRYFSSNIQADFNQAFTGGPVFDCPIGSQIGVNNVCGFFGIALQFINGSGLVSSKGGNLYTLSIQNPAAPRTLSLNDPGGSASFCFSVGCSLTSPALTTPTIGGGTTLTKYYVVSGAITPAVTNANTCAEQTFTPAAFNGVINAGDNIFLNGSATMAANGVFPVMGIRAVANGVAVTYCNSTAGNLTAPAVTITVTGTR